MAGIKISSYYEKLHFDYTVIRWIDLLTPSLLYWTFVKSKLAIHSLTKDCRPCTSQVELDVYLCPVFRTPLSCILVPDVCELVARIFESPWAAACSSLVHGILYLKIQSTIHCSLHSLVNTTPLCFLSSDIYTNFTGNKSRCHNSYSLRRWTQLRSCSAWFNRNVVHSLWKSWTLWKMFTVARYYIYVRIGLRCVFLSVCYWYGIDVAVLQMWAC